MREYKRLCLLGGRVWEIRQNLKRAEGFPSLTRLIGAK